MNVTDDSYTRWIVVAVGAAIIGILGFLAKLVFDRLLLARVDQALAENKVLQQSVAALTNRLELGNQSFIQLREQNSRQEGEIAELKNEMKEAKKYLFTLYRRAKIALPEGE